MSIQRIRSRRSWVPLLAALVAAIFLVVACGSSDSDSADKGSTATEIDTVYGRVTIKPNPSRFVVLGPGDADILLALGLKPESIVPFATPGLETSWNRQYVGYGPKNFEKAAREPSAVREQVLALKPDVIFAINTVFSADDYKIYSQIAPTITRSGKYPALSEPWEVSARTIAQAVGKTSEANKLIDAAQARIKKAAVDHPELAGKTGAVIWPSEPGSVYIYAPQDSRGASLSALGLHQPPEVAKVSDPGTDDKWGGEISYENLGLLRTVNYLVVLDGPQAKELRANAVYNALPAVTSGHVAYLDEEASGAMSVGTVLSRPWVVDLLAKDLTS